MLKSVSDLKKDDYIFTAVKSEIRLLKLHRTPVLRKNPASWQNGTYKQVKCSVWFEVSHKQWLNWSGDIIKYTVKKGLPTKEGQREEKYYDLNYKTYIVVDDLKQLGYDLSPIEIQDMKKGDLLLLPYASREFITVELDRNPVKKGVHKSSNIDLWKNVKVKVKYVDPTAKYKSKLFTLDRSEFNGSEFMDLSYKDAILITKHK